MVMSQLSNVEKVHKDCPSIKGTAMVALVCVNSTVFQSRATHDSLQMSCKKSRIIVQSESGYSVTLRNSRLGQIH